MIGGQEGLAAGERVLGTVGEDDAGAAGEMAGANEVGGEGVEGDLAQGEHDAEVGEQVELFVEVGRAGGQLARGGLVVGRGAADGGGDPEVVELHAIVAGDGGWLGGVAGGVKQWVEEGAGAVTGERAAGAVGAVGTGGQAQEEDAGSLVAEAGDGAGPILVVAVGAAFFAGDGIAVCAEARAALAGDDLLVEQGEWGDGLGWDGRGPFV